MFAWQASEGWFYWPVVADAAQRDQDERQSKKASELPWSQQNRRILRKSTKPKAWKFDIEKKKLNCEKQVLHIHLMIAVNIEKEMIK